MIQTLATTTNFVIQFNDAFPFAKQRAQKLQQSAEAEFATLRSWFQNATGFGASNPVTLLGRYQEPGVEQRLPLEWHNARHHEPLQRSGRRPAG